MVLAKASHVVNWHRDNRSLSLVSDDFTADRRTCVTVSIDRGAAGMLEIRTLRGYNAKLDQWGEYCDPRGSHPLPHKRGQKALLDWIQQIAVKEKGWPNPESFTHYAVALAA